MDFLGQKRVIPEQRIFLCKGDIIKVNKAFAGRISLPEYLANPLDATMAMDGLRTNDSGTYHCQVVMGNDYERDTVPLVVSGKRGSLSHKAFGYCCKAARLSSPGEISIWAN